MVYIYIFNNDGKIIYSDRYYMMLKESVTWLVPLMV